ncbi:WD40-repeat-containing domain protein [Suillus bovinus]|uniref:WD40-repeat-containing domain protein n=1 Tax=Suillus bovinus TaxID=48563 RepID=UPI001B86F258|nr:WD40-repeat-containing domain protein [Suillus bovinus]KAG2138646.1 WD40-repeat-containing domain protein [Suillus bovinus]
MSIAGQTRQLPPTPTQAKSPPPKQNFEGHARTIRDFVFLHDNIHIVTGSEDGTMRKWNYDTGLLVGKPWSGEGGSIYALVLSPDGKTIACGRADGSVQRWNTDGQMMLEGVWTGHNDWVRSLSWSPNGSHIASGSDDGTILIRKVESGIVEVGPIKTKQYRVCALAYSPSGNRIASGGWNTTICIWDSKTGELALGLIQGLGYEVTSVVWSSDSTKLYSASDKSARVFDSTSGALLHCFQHVDVLYSIALSPTHNVLACVGDQGVVQLWDTESYKLVGQPFGQNHKILRCASFSRDGRYLACGGHDRTLAMWTVDDIAPQLIPTAKLSWGDHVSDEGHVDLWDSLLWYYSQKSLPLESSGTHVPHVSFIRRLWNVISRHRPPANESVSQEPPNRGFFARCSRSNSSVTIVSSQPTAWKVWPGEDLGKDEQEEDMGASKLQEYGSKQRNGSLVDIPSPPPYNFAPQAELHSEEHRNFWRRVMQAPPPYDLTPPAELRSKVNRSFWRRLMHI